MFQESVPIPKCSDNIFVEYLPNVNAQKWRSKDFRNFERDANAWMIFLI
jgi:hypothetical protein